MSGAVGVSSTVPPLTNRNPVREGRFMADTHSISFPACFPVEYRSIDGLGFLGYCVGTDGSVWSRRKPGCENELEDYWHRMKTDAGKTARYKTVMLIREDGTRI